MAEDLVRKPFLVDFKELMNENDDRQHLNMNVTSACRMIREIRTDHLSLEVKHIFSSSLGHTNPT